MRAWLNFFILFCFLPISVCGQKKLFLSGKVLDTQRIPVSQAMVVVEGTTMGTYSDNNGKFTLTITPGEHTISVSAYGFNLQKKTIKISSSENLNFILEEQSFDLSAVNVYGKSTSQLIREGSFSVNAIEIKNLANSLNNISTAIGRSSGIKIREDGGVGSDFDLSINGLSGNSIRYFIDGIPLSFMGNGISLANLPVNIVERIEIYKGVVPVDLGSDALGGAINIITKKDVNNYLDVSYGIGSFGTHKADFNAQYIDHKTGLFIQPSIGMNYSENNYEMRGVQVWDPTDSIYKEIDTERFHDDYFSFLSQLKIGFTNKKWADLFSVSTSYFYSDKELQTGSKQIWVYGMATRKNLSYNISSNYLKKNLFTKGLSVNLNLSHTWDFKTVTDTTYRNYYWDGSYSIDKGLRSEINKGAKSIRHTERPLTLARGNFNYIIKNKHIININYLLNYLSNFRYDDIDEDFEPAKDVFSKQFFGISYNQILWQGKISNSFFFKDYISYLKIEQQDKYWITGSNEVKQSSTTNNQGYGFSSRFRFFEQIALKVSYEHSARLPIALEFLGNGITIDPNFKLIPENSDNINTGLFGTFQIYSNHRLYYETGLFYREVEDYILFVPTQTEDKGGQFDNVDNVTVKGVEWEFRYYYNNSFQVITNFTYLNERNKTKYQENGKPDNSYNNKIPNRPWLFGNLEINYRKKDVLGRKDNQLKLTYNYQYVHWFYLTWAKYGFEHTKSRIPTQYLNNVQVTYSLKNEKYNVSLQCNNILDHTIYDNYKMQKPGRSFFLKLRIFIN
jgi:outer membrane cobalamin receptor